ncbi:MAG TPA: hypothetical protein VGL34_03375 [Steroidobacteraceae bacterium]|jgi:hypothetical protein
MTAKVKRVLVMTPEQRKWHNERNKRWREANPEKHNMAIQRWREANPEQVCAYRKQQYNKNPTKYQKRSSTWAKARPDLVRANGARRRARKLNACPSWSDLAAIAHLEAARWVYASLMLVDESEVHLDHVIPLKASIYIGGKLVQIASGLHVADNLQFKLGRDNISKGCRFDEAELNYQPIYEETTP